MNGKPEFLALDRNWLEGRGWNIGRTVATKLYRGGVVAEVRLDSRYLVTVHSGRGLDLSIEVRHEGVEENPLLAAMAADKSATSQREYLEADIPSVI